MKYTTDQILQMLMSREFENWYAEGGSFDNYVGGGMVRKTKQTHGECLAEIKKQLESMLG
jgi:hypothetical protein